MKQNKLILRDLPKLSTEKKKLKERMKLSPSNLRYNLWSLKGSHYHLLHTLIHLPVNILQHLQPISPTIPYSNLRVTMMMEHLHRKTSLISIYRRSEEHTSELQSHSDLVCRLLLAKTSRMSHTPLCDATSTGRATAP